MNNYDAFKLQQLLVKTILDRPHLYDWTVQGLGMMRMYLNEETRLHIWHSNLVVPEVTEIHDHPWDFESLIIAGAITDRWYIICPKEGEKGALPYYQHKLFCGVGGHLEEDPTPIWLVPWDPNGEGSTYRAGDTYDQRYYHPHRTAFVDGTVTIIKRKVPQGGDPDYANVYYERDKEFVSGEPRAAKPKEISRVALAALELLK